MSTKVTCAPNLTLADVHQGDMCPKLERNGDRLAPVTPHEVRDAEPPRCQCASSMKR